MRGGGGWAGPNKEVLALWKGGAGPSRPALRVLYGGLSLEERKIERHRWIQFYSLVNTVGMGVEEDNTVQQNET